MNKAPLLGLIILLSFSCKTMKEGDFINPPPLYAAPKVVKLNTGNGYAINPVWGDTIRPVINSLGDTVITGRPIPLKGKVIYLDSMPPPEIVRAKKPLVTPIKRKISKVPEVESIVPVFRDSLKSYFPGNAKTDNFLVNSFNDTIPTGIRIPARGKKVPCLQPKPEEVLPPRMMDKTRINLQYLDSRQNLIPSFDVCMKDRKGNVWFGGPGYGFIRYNGASSTLYKFDHGLSGNWITKIFEDSRGNIWIACDINGVTMYDGETFTWFTEWEGLCNNDVRSIIEDHRGNIWIATINGVSMYDGESFIHYTVNEGLSNNSVNSLYEDSSHAIWFGTNGGGVSCFDGKKFTHLTEKDGLCFNEVYSILEDHLGNMWFGTRFGKVSKYDGDVFTNYIIGQDQENGLIMSMIEDSNFDLWFGISVGGVAVYDGEYIDLITEKDGLSSNVVHDVLEVIDDQFWFATRYGGMNIYRKESFISFTTEDGLSDRVVLGIQEDKNGRLWFGTNFGGVNIYDGSCFNTYSLEHGLISSCIISLKEDPDGNIWMAHSLGMTKFDGEYFTHFTKRQGLNEDWLYDLCVDRMGDLWFANDIGIGKYTDSCFTFYTEMEGLSRRGVLQICKDPEGNIWIGGIFGISKLYGDSIIHYTEKDGLSRNEINFLLTDSTGLLWIGTNYGGISVFNGETFTQITTNEGLCSNSIRSICEDRYRNIWVSTSRGINYIECDRDHQGDDLVIKRVSSYGLNDGLSDSNFRIFSKYLDSQNRIWWGHGKGLTMLDLNRFHISEEIPEVQLDWIEINGTFVDFRHANEINGIDIDFSEVKRFCNLPLDLKLQSSLNHLTFNFAAIDWGAPHKLMYSYKMEDLEDSWSPVSSETRADYRNLPPGKFTFKVAAIGESQVWSEPFEYSFTILPPWYRSLLAQTIYILLLFLVIYLFIRYRTRRIWREKIFLQREVEIRTAELREKNDQIVEMENMKTKFFTDISHEIRTPLSLIVGPLNYLLKDPPIEKKRNEWLQLIKRNSQRLLQLVNQLLDISRLESGRMILKLEKTDIIKNIHLLAFEYSSLAESRDMQFIIDIPDLELCVWHDRDKIQKVVMNLLSNAFKFTHAGGTVTIRLKVISNGGNEFSDPRLRIMVADTGPGIPLEEKDKIFERFYRAQGNLFDDAGGTGIGLSMSKEFIKMLHGEILVKSLEGVGSVFIVEIPTGKEFLRETEYTRDEPGS